MATVVPSLTLESIPAELARRDFTLFVKLAWPVIEPGTQFVPGWHLDAICEHLTAVSSGQIKRLLVNMPPRHMKSSLISVMWPMWCWLSDPSIQWLCASYALSLSIRDNRKCRLLIQSPWFQERYGDVFQLSGDQNLKGRFENTMRGYRLATSTGGSSTGEGGSILLIDDLHAAADSISDIKRESAVTWFRETWSSRLNNRETGAMVVVGQRVHRDDVSGFILEQGGWEHLILPAEYDRTRACTTSIGWTDPRTIDGDLLWPARFNHVQLAQIKDDIGALGYATQYLQSPVPPGGFIFKSSDERQFTQDEDTYQLQTPAGPKIVLKADCWLFGTVDLAISSKQTADYTVVDMWAVTPDRDLLLLHSIKGRWSHPEQQSKIKQAFYQFQPDYFLVENVAYQLAIIQDLLADGITCREYKPTRDKVSRASGAAVWQAAGKIYFLAGAPWLISLQNELYFFPKASHDDETDNVSMAADNVRARGPLAGEDEIPHVEPPAPATALDVQAALPVDPFEYADSVSIWGGVTDDDF